MRGRLYSADAFVHLNVCKKLWWKLAWESLIEFSFANHEESISSDGSAANVIPSFRDFLFQKRWFKWKCEFESFTLLHFLVCSTLGSIQDRFDIILDFEIK